MAVPDVAVVLDALLLATIGGAAILAGAWVVTVRWRGLSGHLRHAVLGYALVAGVAILVATLCWQPGPVGCLTGSCGPEPDAGQRSRAEEFYLTAGSGKFTGDTPPPHVPVAAAARPGAAARWRDALVLVWLAGATVSLFRSGRGRRAAVAMTREAVPATDPIVVEAARAAARRLGVGRPVRLLHHPAVTTPAVSGVIRPVVFLPDGFARLPRSHMEMVLLHEMAHVRRRDPFVSLLSDVTTAAFWFNPLVRRAARRLRDLQELAADSQVVQQGVRPSLYADYLLDAFRRARGMPFVPAGVHSILGECLMEMRVRSVLDPATVHRRPPALLRLAVPTAFVLAVGAAAAAPVSLQAMGLLTPLERTQDARLDHALLTERALDSVLRPVFIDKMADRYVAGAAVAVVYGGDIVYRAGFGRREVYRELPVDADRTIFRIGSITKVLTGVSVMQLVERGLLRLDADVNDYLDEVRVPSTFDEPVRVRDLLTHTAGFDQIGLGRHVTSRDAVRPLGDFLSENLVRIRPPGEVTTYDTYAITLAGYLVERLSGLPYEEYLRRHVFEPLAMHRSGITVPPALAHDVAVGYEFRGEWFPQEWEYMNTDPASTVNATVTDMANFAIMLLDGGRFRGRQVLSEASVNAMLRRQYGNHPDQPGYGYTFWEDWSHGVRGMSHGGSMTGYGTFLYLLPEHDLGVFIAYNQESGTLASLVLSRLMSALFPNRPPARPMRPRLPRPVDLSRFVGTYASSIYHHGNPQTGWRRRPFEIGALGDSALSFGDAPAYQVGPLTFQRDDGVLLTFRENDDGAITFLFVNQAVYERLDSH